MLECKVPNSRIPTAWFREDQRLLPCRKYEQIEEGPVRRLIIHRLKADDDGVYLCEMRGRVRTVANVTVKGGEPVGTDWTTGTRGPEPALTICRSVSQGPS